MSWRSRRRRQLLHERRRPYRYTWQDEAGAMGTGQDSLPAYQYYFTLSDSFGCTDTASAAAWRRRFPYRWKRKWRPLQQGRAAPSA
ncbi:MAG: hypothetical protein H6559_18995 [Lewinellaceae bacterium]|nr:hypothetical protein [Lewinellaceae bacterium]